VGWWWWWECRIPEEALGYSVITLYVDENIKKIEADNSKVLRGCEEANYYLEGRN
jgi:hypothetical protein